MAEITISGDGQTGELTLAGELDVAEVRHVIDLARTAVIDRSVGRLVIDLSEVTFIDSTGIGALISISRMVVETNHCSVELRSPSVIVSKVLQVTAVDGLFPVAAE